MPDEIHLVRNHDNTLMPASQHDWELLQKWKPGQAVKVSAVKVTQRSLEFHRKYWALVNLAFEYWEPTGGLVSPQERKAIQGFMAWLGETQGANQAALDASAQYYLQDLERRRGERIQIPEKSKDALHRFIKIEAGWYDIEQTPAGLRKVARSINFNSMKEEEFSKFYPAAFNVCWRFILSRNFDNERQAEQAASQLLNFE